MNPDSLREFDQIPFPARGELKFVSEICRYSGKCAEAPRLTLPEGDLLPETARSSLERHFPVGPGGVPVEILTASDFAAEEFELEIGAGLIRLRASGASGFRYGVCELEERLAAGFSGKVRRKPYITRRISRCFFSPNSRPPLRLDELTDDVDYYPEPYLDRMMHERINGVWITVYLSDMPSPFFPERGKDAPRRLEKLRRVVERCARYGIKCYLFMAEPRIFGDHWKSNTLKELALHPEFGGHRSGNSVCFCTSALEGRAYLADAIGHIFSSVPGLGGVINIMCQESSNPCALWRLYPHSQKCNCPRCSRRSAAELFAEIARTMSQAMKKHQPDAEFFGWFYAAFHRPGEPENEILQQIARAWPAEDTLLYNCETGGKNIQFGRELVVQDYSLSWPGPSDYWLELAGNAPKIGAKMQTGCSHEDAGVPYLPVPDILFDRYDGLKKTRCAGVMQCWYFGSAPGVMNRAAGRLSFLPFPESREEFLLELARPEWGAHAETVVRAWTLFGEGYRNFPETLPFKWFGPLHGSIVFPWHLRPADLPMAPSYTQMASFPNSGDRIGECVGYELNFAEVRELLGKMDSLWARGLELLKSCADTPERNREAELAEAIGLQFSSTRRMFEFYFERERMIHLRIDTRKRMRSLIEDEIEAAGRMTGLCLRDSRLGYHAEVESYLFFPAKLQARIGLLRETLAELENFAPDAPELKRYRGEGEACVEVGGRDAAFELELGGTKCRVFHEKRRLFFCFREISAPVLIEFEPGRMNQIIAFRLSGGKHDHSADFQPGLRLTHDGNDAVAEFDLDFFQDFRVSDSAPYRFNLSCGTEALKKRHPWPFRLCHGESNPADLVFLKLT